MTRIVQLLMVESYTDTLLDALRLPAEQFEPLKADVIKRYEVYDAGSPIASSQYAMQERALHLLYDAAIRDGADEVIRDLKESELEVGTAELSRVEELFENAEVEGFRVSAMEARDAVMPLLTNFRFNVDFRSVATGQSALGEDRLITLLPFVSVRLSFDEVIASGSSNIVFQLNPPELKRLAQGLTRLSEKVAEASSGNVELSILELEGE
ncbi:hypothetical protein ACWGOE_04185 [Leucobacter chromiiresistens]